MAKFEFYFHAGCLCSEREQVVEIPDEELDGLSESEVSDLVDLRLQFWVDGQIEQGYKRVQ